ncbi:MAG: serine protein kinase RIO [Nitrososphaerota archaeon]
MRIDKIEKKIRQKEYLLDREQRYLRKRSELNEVLEEVFDKLTLMTIYDLMKSGEIKEFYGVLSAGKESRVYLALGKEGKIAVKIYLVLSAEFKRNRIFYVSSDPRFKKIPKDFREFIYLWARREFNNLEKAYQAMIKVPKPLFVKNNVLGMSFMGIDDTPYPKLVELSLSKDEYNEIYKQVLENIFKLYNNAGLIHGDLSEYNIFIDEKLNPIFMDFSQAVLSTHPHANDLLHRDIKNITKFFNKKGVTIIKEEEVFNWILGKKDGEF